MGVSLHSPPNNLWYETILAKRKPKASAFDDGVSICHHGGCGSQQLPVNLDKPQPSPNAGIQKYVEFIGMHNQDNIIQTLVKNDLENYKIFQSPNLNQSALRALGFTLGVVKQHCDNVAKFEKHIAKQNLLGAM